MKGQHRGSARTDETAERPAIPMTDDNEQSPPMDLSTPNSETVEQTLARLLAENDTLKASQVKQPRELMVIAIIGLICITGSAVGGLVWAVVVHGAGTDALTTIAAVGVAAIAGALGGRASVTAKDTTDRV